jgi:hypothetical protein
VQALIFILQIGGGWMLVRNQHPIVYYLLSSRFITVIVGGFERSIIYNFCVFTAIAGFTKRLDITDITVPAQ